MSSAERKKRFSQYQHLSNQAVQQFHTRNHRASATSYREAIEALGHIDPYEENRWQIFTGYTSILRECYFTPDKSDVDFLVAVSRDESELRLFRSEAAYTVGLLRWDAGERQEAAEYYRDAILIGEKCIAEELSKMFMAGKISADGQRVLGLEMRPVRDLISDSVETARGNLAVLESPQSQVLPAHLKSRIRSDGSEMPPSIRSSKMLTSGSPTITEEQFNRLISVGGDRCDFCQKTPKEVEVDHLMKCSKCKKAFYCSKECATAQWRAGHKKACRGPGEYQAGDFVRLRGLVSTPTLNGSIVRLAGRAPQPGRWAVTPDGNSAIRNTISVAEEKLEQLRPLL